LSGRRLAALIACATLAAGCGSHRSVLDAGVTFGPMAKPRRISASEARHDARVAHAEWRREIAKRARQEPRTHFPNLAPFLLRQRLAEAAKRYGFDVVSLRLLRPRQLAPEVVVRTKRYFALARAMPAIEAALNPRLRAQDDRLGWEYEGFWFEAQDEHGVPFLLVFDFMRGPGPGGGQWARSDPLFPFAHG
jgi:hypothetical protein